MKLEELEEQAVTTFKTVVRGRDETGDGVQGGGAEAGLRSGSVAGSRPSPATVRASRKKKGKGKGKKGGKDDAGDSLNVYGIHWGLGVAALGAAIAVLEFRYKLGGGFTRLFGGYATLFVLALGKIIGLAIAMYVACLMFDRRPPMGNVLIIAGLVTWVPTLVGWVPLRDWNIAIIATVGWLWMLGSTYAIYSGMLETDNDSLILFLVVIQALVYFLIDREVSEATFQVAHFLESVF